MDILDSQSFADFIDFSLNVPRAGRRSKHQSFGVLLSEQIADLSHRVIPGSPVCFIDNQQCHITKVSQSILYIVSNHLRSCDNNGR